MIRGWARFLALLLLLTPCAAAAHHGVATLGAAGLEGPGAPLETSTSMTLPRGSILTYFKLDHARWERYTIRRDEESIYSTFWLFGLGYGVRSWLSAYAFLPYNQKTVEGGSSNSSGFADIALNAVLGFKYDDRLRLVPENQSLDDLEDWHFSLYLGMTLPTGDPNTRTRTNEIDPGLDGSERGWRATGRRGEGAVSTHLYLLRTLLSDALQVPTGPGQGRLLSKG